MIVNVYTIYDSKSKAYAQPWMAPNHSTAFRNCTKACMPGSNNPCIDFPADYTLFCVGTFDELTGLIEGFQAHENLGNFLQFLPEPQVSPAGMANTVQ
jgi:hypothetical protein